MTSTARTFGVLTELGSRGGVTIGIRSDEESESTHQQPTPNSVDFLKPMRPKLYNRCLTSIGLGSAPCQPSWTPTPTSMKVRPLGRA